ncbi:hypothetical protein ACQ4PT_058847 [Festuca glaucescens]
MSEHIGTSSFVPKRDESESPHGPPPAVPNVFLAGWPGSDPPAPDEPALVAPIAILSPLTTYAPHALEFSSIQEEFLAEQEDLRRMSVKVLEAEQKKASKGSKVINRDGLQGSWYPCNPDPGQMQIVLDEGFLKKDLIEFFKDEMAPAPKPGYVVMCCAWIERGLSLPPSKFFFEVLDKYGLQPHNICPNSYTVLSNFQDICEGYLGVDPDIRLFQWEWFYHKNITTKDQPQGLPEFKDGAAKEVPFWKGCPNLDDHQNLLRMAQRIGKLTEQGLKGSDVTLSWFTRRIQPLQFRTKLICRFTNMMDKMCITTQTLPVDSVKIRARTLYKVTKDNSDFKIAVDIYMNSRESCLFASGRTWHFGKTQETKAEERKKKVEEEEEDDDEDDDDEDEDDTQEEVYVTRTTKRHLDAAAKEPEGSGKKQETATTDAPEGSGRKRKASASTTLRPNSKAAERAKRLKGAGKNTQPTLPQMGCIPDSKGSKKVGVSKKAKAFKPSPAAAPSTLATSKPNSAPGSSGLCKSPTDPDADDAPTDPAPKNAFTISSTDREDRGGDGGGAEVESGHQKIDFAAATAAMMANSYRRDTNAAIGTAPAALTSFRMKSYTKMLESDKWDFANDCAEILMKRVWDNPSEKYDAMKKAIDDFLDHHRHTLKEHEALHAELYSNNKALTNRVKQLMDVGDEKDNRIRELEHKLKQKRRFICCLRKRTGVPLGFPSEQRAKYPQDDVFKLAGATLQDLLKVCRDTCQFLGIKGSNKCNVHQLVDHMKDVPDFIGDKQESSARGAARTALALCLTRNPSLDLELCTAGVPKGSDTNAILRECHGLDSRVVAMINHQAFYDILELSPANKEKERLRLEEQKKKPAEDPADACKMHT